KRVEIKPLEGSSSDLVGMGGVVGETISSSKVENVTSHVTIVDKGYRLGGIIGRASNTIITKVASNVYIRGNASSYIGGLVGGMTDSSIAESFSRGDLAGIGNSGTGGIIGRIEGGTNIIENVYTESNIKRD